MPFLTDSAPTPSRLSSTTTTLRRLLSFAALALLGACSALPRIHPDMAPDAPPALAGARGPLSAERSRRILDTLRAQGGSSSVLERHLALEAEFADSPLVAGNRVQLLQDGPATYRAMLAAIRGARDSIDMESYIFEGDDVGREFADALIEKQRQGVQVNLIYDSIGAFGTPAEFFAPLKAAGVALVEFNPIDPLQARAGWSVNQRDHRKLLVVDGQTAFLGGVNISSVYSGGSMSRGSGGPGRLPWRDTDLQIDGPVVAELQKLFFATWTAQKGPTPAERRYFPPLTRQGDEVVHAIGSVPEAPYSPIYATLISAIDSAETEIWLTAAYFVPDPQLRAALAKAAARGVDVRILLPSKTDSALVLNAGQYYYDELLRGGIRLYERQDALLHAKTVMIDGVWSTVGSTNLDWRSFLHNQELSAVVLGSDFGERMRAAFRRDLTDSKEITLAAWRQRGLDRRLKEAFGRLWQYWL